MDRIEAMKRFVAVAHTGSFTQAAEQLNVPKSAISSSIAKLEKHLHVRLLHRSTRSVALTEIGKEYLAKCHCFLQELDAFEDHFRQPSDELSGLICVDMPGSFYNNVVLPNITKWFELHPKTEIKLIGADHRINPIKERVDFVVRVGELTDSNLVAKRLGIMPIINCASRTYLEKFGTPTTLEDLPKHYLIGYSTGDANQATGFEYKASGKTHYLDMPHRITVSTTNAYMASCLAGLGIIQVPKIGAHTHLKSGELVEVLPSYRCQPMPVSIVYESRQYMPKKTSAFIAWLTQIFDEMCAR